MKKIYLDENYSSKMKMEISNIYVLMYRNLDKNYILSNGFYLRK